MKTIQSLSRYIGGTSRHQIQFASLDDFIAADNPVRIHDAFIEKFTLWLVFNQ